MGERVSLGFVESYYILVVVLTDFFGSMYTFKRDLIVGYFFQMATACLGCTLGMAISAFNLAKQSDSEIRAG